jgi:mono/diheme cytochrome c family protein
LTRWPAAAVAACALAFAAAVPAVVASHSDGTRERPAAGAATHSSQPPAAPDGRDVFIGAGCAECHTLAGADAHGRVGPDLDRRLVGLSPRRVRRIVERQVRRGGGGMPPFRGLSRAQIAAVAAYVARAAAG